jgi:hypothetical protein
MCRACDAASRSGHTPSTTWIAKRHFGQGGVYEESGIPGAIDSAAAGAQTLYVQSGPSSTVYAFSIGAGGALTPLQVAAVPDGGSQEGIVVT